eukprot:CAMPEP_0168758590 /NCGR_PEP_ID=MMETSP0724-20121128/21782_1 /TAXON_ID=265536 /ORGANISM="Amphiprora sp., Strain CCMP467" /LENGTH=147 /DNA_ID=CAMNT_0008807479 /DNA_START=107 /DNA_END=550 /DNA_ORIENTATION=+
MAIRKNDDTPKIQATKSSGTAQRRRLRSRQIQMLRQLEQRMLQLTEQLRQAEQESIRIRKRIDEVLAQSQRTANNNGNTTTTAAPAVPSVAPSSDSSERNHERKSIIVTHQCHHESFRGTGFGGGSNSFGGCFLCGGGKTGKKKRWL